jgi:hypothetical protein
MSEKQLKEQQNLSAVGTTAPIVTPLKKKKAPYPFWLGGVAASIAASITQYVPLITCRVSQNSYADRPYFALSLFIFIVTLNLESFASQQSTRLDESQAPSIRR